MSNSPKAIKLTTRSVLAISGAEARALLQGLISNNIDAVSEDNAIYAALLTPQGKILADFFIAEHAGEDDSVMLLDCETARKDDLVRRLMMYRLRADMEIVDKSEKFDVWALIGAEGLTNAGAAETCCGGVIFTDPRLSALGRRAILPTGNAPKAEEAAEDQYDRHRLALGVPDGSQDIAIEKRLMLEANFEELGGVDFTKGCYIGQELAARMKYRGRVRKRILPVKVTRNGDAPLPAPGSAIKLNGKAAGEMCSGRDDRALAILRVEDIGAGEFTTEDGTVITPDIPGWLQPAIDAANAAAKKT